MDAETESESMIKFCKPTASQEAKLPNFPFVRESENFADSSQGQFSSSADSMPSKPTEIVMISPPGSLGSVNQHTVEEDAVFLTPPEHHSHSHLSSSEDQNRNEYCAEGMAIAEAGEGSKKVMVSEAGLDDEPEAKRVRVEAGEEFEGETVSLGETEVVEIEGDESAQDTDVVSDNGDSGGEERDTLCLAEGSLDITGEAVTTGGLMKEGVNKFDAINELGEKHECMEDRGNKPSGNSDSSLDIDIIEEGNVMLKEIVGEKFSEVKLKSGSEKFDEISKDGGVRTNGERIKEIEEFRYRGDGNSVSGGRRQLPPSLKGKEKEVAGDWENWKKKGLLDLLDDLKAVLEDTEEDDSKAVDIVETLKKKGATFPRPRWWPPEGEDWSYGLP